MSKNFVEMEKEISKDISGNLTIGSGNVNDDGDVKDETLLVEAKKRGRKNFTVDLSHWNKVVKQAKDLMRIPALIYENENEEKIVILSYDDFVEIYNGWKKNI